MVVLITVKVLSYPGLQAEKIKTNQLEHKIRKRDYWFQIQVQPQNSFSTHQRTTDAFYRPTLRVPFSS